jgi:hypothetical protein
LKEVLLEVLGYDESIIRPEFSSADPVWSCAHLVGLSGWQKFIRLMREKKMEKIHGRLGIILLNRLYDLSSAAVLLARTAGIQPRQALS